MNSKDKINELSSKIQELTESLGTINKELIAATSLIPTVEVSDSAKVMAKIGYPVISHDDPTTWVVIRDYPELVLFRWTQRLWIERKRLGYKNQALEDQLGKKGAKSVENFLFWSDSFIISAVCSPPHFDKAHSELVRYYQDGTNESRAYYKVFFDMLEEELLKYESGYQ